MLCSQAEVCSTDLVLQFSTINNHVLSHSQECPDLLRILLS